MDGEAWWATVHGVTKSQTELSDFTHVKLGDHAPSAIQSCEFKRYKTISK